MSAKIIKVYRDRKHWGLGLGRIRIGRWCAGAPCHLPVKSKHPVAITMVPEGFKA